VINEEVLHRIKGEMNILPDTKRWKTNLISHIMGRNCVLTYVVEGKIEGMRRRGRKRKQPMNDRNEKRTLQFEKEAVDRRLWRNSFQRVCGPLTIQNSQ
jgi:hypothetical protein